MKGIKVRTFALAFFIGVIALAWCSPANAAAYARASRQTSVGYEVLFRNPTPAWSRCRIEDSGGLWREFVIAPYAEYIVDMSGAPVTGVYTWGCV